MTYRRRFDPQGEDSLARLARWVPPGATVLELGPSAGHFTRHLTSLGCTVDVVEIDRADAAEAAAFARRTVVADLDGGDWVGELGEMRYERIVCADVLEHLRDGVELLRRLRTLCAEGGELLLSVPNVAHSALIVRLLDERFEYGGEGLLDATHLRLYTWRSLAQALHEAGWHAAAWDATTLSLYGSEFRVSEQGLDPALRALLERRSHGLVYQWLVRALPGTRVDSAVPQPEAGAAGVPVRLLQAEDEERLTLEGAAVRALRVDGARATLEWPIARGARALRLLLADRAGVIEVHALSLCAGDDVLWTDGGDPESIACDASSVRIDPVRFALAGDGAWIAPRAPAEVIARAGSLRATLAWPPGVAQSDEHAAFDALAAALREAQAAARARNDELVAMVQARDRQLAVMYAEAASVEARVGEARAAAGAAQDAAETAAREVDRLEHALAAQERIIAYRQSVRWWLGLPWLRARLAWRKAKGQ